MDLVMPGMSGNETCRRIKSSPSWRDIPLIILTSHEGRDAMLDGINAGADDYILKTGDLGVLKARVRAQIRRKQFEDENRHIREQLFQKETEAAEARAIRELAETRARLLEDLEKKNKELEAFSYSVSHDLRAPLRAIEGFSNILLEDHSKQLDGEGKRILNVIVSNVAKMGNLIDDLLELSRVGRTRLNIVQVDMGGTVHSIMNEIVQSVSQRRIKFQVGHLPPAQADPVLIRQVFFNLIDNAVKYTRKVEEPLVEISGRVDQDENVYIVQDNGVGFDMQYAQKLFGVFQRLHSSLDFEGTGVGLAIVQRVVQRHGGRVWAEGKVDQGATFYFTLPKGGLEDERHE
jgi:light-regulated signal transduction histidine kinase (bacteriophytochrome)